jgi:protein-L-isoaspartate O-methyltransferase
LKITGFIWLEDVVQKLLRKHAVTQEEIAEVFANLPRFRFVEKGIVQARMFMLPLGKQLPDDI